MPHRRWEYLSVLRNLRFLVGNSTIQHTAGGKLLRRVLDTGRAMTPTGLRGIHSQQYTAATCPRHSPSSDANRFKTQGERPDPSVGSAPLIGSSSGRVVTLEGFDCRASPASFKKCCKANFEGGVFLVG